MIDPQFLADNGTTAEAYQKFLDLRYATHEEYQKFLAKNHVTHREYLKFLDEKDRALRAYLIDRGFIVSMSNRPTLRMTDGDRKIAAVHIAAYLQNPEAFINEPFQSEPPPEYCL